MVRSREGLVRKSYAAIALLLVLSILQLPIFARRATTPRAGPSSPASAGESWQITDGEKAALLPAGYQTHTTALVDITKTGSSNKVGGHGTVEGAGWVKLRGNSTPHYFGRGEVDAMRVWFHNDFAVDRYPRTRGADFYGVGATLELAVDAPSALEVEEGLYVPMPFTVTATVTNTGAVAATDAMVTTSLPISLTLDAGQSLTQPIGDLGPGQSQAVTWSVTAITLTRGITLTYTVEAWAENAEAIAEAKEIFIPGIAGLGTLSLEQTSLLTNTGVVMTSTLPSDLALVTGSYRAASVPLGDVSAGQALLPSSCGAYYAQGYRTDGIYTIKPGGSVCARRADRGFGERLSIERAFDRGSD